LVLSTGDCTNAIIICCHTACQYLWSHPADWWRFRDENKPDWQ